MATMKSNKQVFSLVAMIALLAVFVFSAASVSALGSISSVEVNGIEAANGQVNVAAFAGDTLAVKVVFNADENANDTRIKAWITGESDLAVSTERFDVFDGSVYSRLITVPMPATLDPQENLELHISVESKNSGTVETTVNLAGQRESYLVQVLDVNMDSKVAAGSSIPVDIVLKNRGLHLAEDTFVQVTIPALGVEQKAYFGDLSAVDQSDPDKEDAVERRMVLRIPSDAPAGVYNVQIDAFNADSQTTVTKKLAITSAGAEDSMVVSPVQSKTFAAGQTASYSLTIVNSGSNILVYDLVVDAPNGLVVNVDQPVIAVPAGTSATVKMDVSASKAGTYNFAVNVHSNGDLVKRSEFVANVEGAQALGGTTNTTVLLTVVLAIVFVVLLVVLIVLLTRKPQKSEEFGESYY